MHVDGGCHCGAIKFEAEVDPERTVICHCADCRRTSATAFRVIVPVLAKNFTLLQGAPKEYVKTAESGAKRALAFCETCGGGLYGAPAEGPREILTVRVGAIDQADVLAPKREVWRRSALSWLGDWPGLPAREKG